MRVARLWGNPVPLRAWLARSSAQRPSSPALRSFFSAAQPPTTRRQAFSFSTRQIQQLPRSSRSIVRSRPFRSVRFNSSKPSTQNPNPTPHLGSPEPTPSLSQRLKKLSREYGWSAVGVYFTLSALDFPFCFLAVRGLGTERIGHYEEVVVNAVMSVVQIPFPNLGKKKQVEEAEVSIIPEGVVEATEREGRWASGIDEAEAANQGAGASVWTQLALAYAIHKSFIFLRVPLTAAVTPKVVKTLRSWGWDIGKRKPKKPKSS